MDLIVRDTQGGKAAGRYFRIHLRSCIRFLDFKRFLANPDAWMRPSVKKDGTEHWVRVLFYTDNYLVISDE